jgi:hypothetical protein
MERRFDLRNPSEREQLAAFLPAFDARVFNIPSDAFIQGLADVAEYLGNPEWLTYQWGILGPLRAGKRLLHVELERIILLGHELRSIAALSGFAEFIRPFSNISQFYDCLFEARIASMFARLNATSNMVLVPEHTVRGRLKRPEFDAETVVGSLSVECKQRNPSSHNIASRLGTVVDAVADAMDSSSWPDHLRLELEILRPLREQTSDFAAALIERAQRASIGSEFQYGGARVFVVERTAPFRITQMQIGQDRMNGPHGVSTHLLNPAVTSLRVAFNDVAKRTASVIGAQITSALAQLPEDRYGLIFLGDAPLSAATLAIERRIGAAPYDNILAVGIFDSDQLHFVFREARRVMLQELFALGMRPLFAA